MEALKEATALFVLDPDQLGIENLREYEYFAVLALWLIGDCIEIMKTKLDLIEGARGRRAGKSLDAMDTARVGRQLIDAMDAVGHAEYLRARERAETRYEAQIQKIQDAQAVITDEDMARIRAEVYQEVAEETRTRRTQQSIENNRLRHQHNNEVKNMVLGMWEEDPTAFPSAEKAGAYYVNVLAERGVDREHRTVVTWIRARAKQLGIRFR